MSERFPGGIISKTAPVPTGPYENGTAPGIWTLEQQAEFAKQGIWPIAGNVPPYIEDVFQTWLYTGNGVASQSINNGIDLTGKGGMTWVKVRNDALSNVLFDTARGNNQALLSDSTSAQVNLPTWSPNTNETFVFGSNGFTVSKGSNVYPGGYVNGGTSYNYASWTFRKQPKFFDVVTYTGDGTQPRTITHNLGSVPGCIIVKRTDTTSDWAVYHRAVDATTPQGYRLELNTTNARVATTSTWNNQAPTSTEFYIGSATYNANGGTYVAYLFAHNAGGFGNSGTDNVISCGSFTTDGSGAATVDLGYEPQWLTMKSTTASSSWWHVNNMAGFVASPSTTTRYLTFNTSDAEQGWGSVMAPTATGFVATGLLGSTTYIYIAIRRGPMKVPTTGTSVFSPNLQTGGGTVTTNFPVDLIISTTPSQSGSYRIVNDRLRGGSTTRAVDLYTNVTDAETTGTGYGFGFDNNTGYRDAYYSNSFSDIYWNFRRAPGFFDEVCYTGTGATNARTHNLTVAPELIICKSRSAVEDWYVLTSFGSSTFSVGYLNATLALTTGRSYASTAELTTQPTATTFSLGTGGPNTSGATYVAYLFASCPGVSKVGSFTGTGTTQVINCGFTAGARFVLIKATSTTGNWLVWDSARGIVAGNDPYLLLNSTAAEVTNTDWVDTAASGFELSNAGGNLANSNGVSYIFLAIA